MPAIHIRALAQRPDIDIAAVLQQVGHAAAETLGLKPTQIHLTWEEVGGGHYVQGSDAPSLQPVDTHPPLVEITAFEGRSQTLIEATVSCVARVLPRALGLAPANVFVSYREVRSGQLFAGGTLKRH